MQKYSIGPSVESHEVAPGEPCSTPGLGHPLLHCLKGKWHFGYVKLKNREAHTPYFLSSHSVSNNVFILAVGSLLKEKSSWKSFQQDSLVWCIFPLKILIWGTSFCSVPTLSGKYSIYITDILYSKNPKHNNNKTTNPPLPHKLLLQA